MSTPRRYADPAARQAAYRTRQAEARRQELQAKGIPPLPTLATLPGEARWQALAQQASRLLHTVQGEMEEYYEQRTERWRESDRGDAFRGRLEAVQEAQAVTEELCR